MKTLLLLRHAKSSREDPSLRDFDRPLNERGIGAAKLMGKFIRGQKLNPDLVISSPAKRAETTSELVLKSSGLNVELRFDERIYEASARRLLEVVSQIEDSKNSVMLVGHNPGFEEFCAMLTDQEVVLPTAALVCIELDVEKWGKAKAKAGQLKWLMKPKELKRR